MRAILMALGLIVAAPAFAGDLLTAPPSPPLSPSEIDSWSKASFARSFSMGALKGDLGTTLLTRFVAQAKAGKIQKMAGGDVAMAWACYDIAGDRVWLSATDEMADKAYLDTVTIKPRNAGDTAGCASLPSAQKAAIDGAVRIGMTKADLIARLGAPSKQKADWLVFRANPLIQGGSTITTLIVRIDGAGKVAFIEASNITAD